MALLRNISSTCALLFAFTLTACGSAGYDSSGTANNSELPSPEPQQPNGTSTTVNQGGGSSTDTNATGAFALNVQGSGFSSAAGKMIYAVLMDSNSTIIGNANSTVATGGAFTATFANKLTKGDSYHVAYYVDTNGNGFCNISNPNVADPNTDAGYTMDVNNVTGNTTVKAAANPAAVTTVCGSFGKYDVMINGTQFTPHNNEMIYVALMDKADGTFVAGPVGQLVVNGVWKAVWPGVTLAGHSYEARYFADQQKDHTCQDHSWVYETPVITGSITATVSHNTAQVAVCSNFPDLN